MVVLCTVGCQGEPLGEPASYEYSDPRLRVAPEWIVYPEARALPELARLMRRARATGPQGGEIIVMETDAPIDSVVEFYLDELEPDFDEARRKGAVEHGFGDFAADEPQLAPLLESLGVEHSRGVVAGTYRTAVIRASAPGSTVSLQRPYRDFTNDTLVDRTLIMVER